MGHHPLDRPAPLAAVLRLLVIGAVAGCASQTPPEAAGPPDALTRPNIVFIFSDDHAAHALSAYGPHLGYGAPLPPTPRLDGLARQGVLFVNSFVTNSICVPSRATLLTGKYGHLTGVLTNQDALHPAETTFPGLLREVGYQTVLVGKWHLREQPAGFDHYEILVGQGPYYNPTFLLPGDTVAETGYTPDLITDRALAWLNRRDRSRPFLLMVHHNASHRFWDPGPDQLHLFRDTVIAEPPTFWDDGSGRTFPTRDAEMTIALDLFDRDLKLEPPANLTDEQLAAWTAAYGPENEAFAAAGLTGAALTRWRYQRYIADYMRTVDALDRSVGRILDRLGEAGLAASTMVVYTSDQGFFLGDRGWFDKRWMYEESIRTPLLVRWPGVVTPGSVNRDLVTNLDFAPTILEAAGAPVPADIQGRSLLPLLRGDTPGDWRDAIYYQYFAYPDWHMVQRQYGIRTARHKLIHFYEVGAWELFDLERDPLEIRSVYDDPQYAGVRADLERRLYELRARYDVPAEDPVPHHPFEPMPGFRRPGAGSGG
jgi:arylsulfatase A-like enzyme